MRYFKNQLTSLDDVTLNVLYNRVHDVEISAMTVNTVKWTLLNKVRHFIAQEIADRVSERSESLTLASLNEVLGS